jgi:hypothetical protein
MRSPNRDPVVAGFRLKVEPLHGGVTIPRAVVTKAPCPIAWTGGSGSWRWVRSFGEMVVTGGQRYRRTAAGTGLAAAAHNGRKILSRWRASW